MASLIRYMRAFEDALLMASDCLPFRYMRAFEDAPLMASDCLPHQVHARV